VVRNVERDAGVAGAPAELLRRLSSVMSRSVPTIT
jgi:hypothetical protein